jgi:hypothetical protein
MSGGLDPDMAALGKLHQSIADRLPGKTKRRTYRPLAARHSVVSTPAPQRELAKYDLGGWRQIVIPNY